MKKQIYFLLLIVLLTGLIIACAPALPGAGRSVACDKNDEVIGVISKVEFNTAGTVVELSLEDKEDDVYKIALGDGVTRIYSKGMVLYKNCFGTYYVGDKLKK